MLDTSIRNYLSRLTVGAAIGAVLAAGLAWTDSGNARPAIGSAAHSPSLSGPGTVVDGDTIVVDGVRIRLEGIDAPEAGQTCNDERGRPWPCGDVATRTLGRVVSAGPLRCDNRGLDKYGRTLAVCRQGSVDINALMVRTGLAWAFVKYSRTYEREEAEARARRVGIWRGDSTPAWDYRANRWAKVDDKAPAGCAIKGNVTRGSRIYHMPWSPWYGKVRMDGGGKRWFCSEAEAIAAGWRPVGG